MRDRGSRRHGQRQTILAVLAAIAIASTAPAWTPRAGELAEPHARSRSTSREPATADPRPTLDGRWSGGEGSRMEISVSDRGLVTGSYRTAVGRASSAVTYRLTGFASGDQIGFCVDWSRPAGEGGVASITCWVGEHTVRAGVEEIRTMWLLDRNVPDAREGADLWSAVHTGAGVFRRVDRESE